MTLVPQIRIFQANDAAVQSSGEYVLYWMTSNRRLIDNFALDRAIQLCHELSKPLLIFEALRIGYRWASDRIHTFIIQGMRDNRRAAEKSGITYINFVESAPDEGKGLLAALSKKACVLVGDYFPCFMLPHMTSAGASQVDVKMELVDSNGLLPIAAGQKDFPTAYAFRRFLQKNLRSHLENFPQAAPFKNADVLKGATPPKEVLNKWKLLGLSELELYKDLVRGLPIDHTVAPGILEGGGDAAIAALKKFLNNGLKRYEDDRSQPLTCTTSDLSPYLHFGQISPHTIFKCIAVQERWSSDSLSLKTDGKRSGWWGMSSHCEAFLDQLITWRELGYNAARFLPNFDRYESLPEWARSSLEKHSGDPRPYIYNFEELLAAKTHDEVWNAAQRELVQTGQMHNYLRMLWGKKVLEWSHTPQEAAETLIELNNRFALDGRNPNSYSGVFWCFGRYDRPWGPERPIFGTIRYMSSNNTVKKLDLSDYLARFALTAK